MNNEWKIKVGGEGPMITQEVFIYRHVANSKVEVLSFGKDAEVTATTYDIHSSPIPPSFKMDHREIPGIINAFVDHARSQGFKTNDESFAKGKLEAVQEHLSDMRKLVFEPQITGVEKRGD